MRVLNLFFERPTAGDDRFTEAKIRIGSTQWASFIIIVYLRTFYSLWSHSSLVRAITEVAKDNRVLAVGKCR